MRHAYLFGSWHGNIFFTTEANTLTLQVGIHTGPTWGPSIFGTKCDRDKPIVFLQKKGGN